jgi:hypothetical protein
LSATIVPVKLRDAGIVEIHAAALKREGET